MKSRPTSPLIVAHRGSSALAPENTRAAFRRAIADGAEGIEFDVRLAKDDIVVFHDATLLRIGQQPGSVAQKSSAELGRTDIGSWFNQRFPWLARPEFASETVPTLRETLELFAAYRGVIYVELKSRESDVKTLSRAVCDIIRDSPLRSQMIVKSFQLDVIPEVKRLCPEVRTAALFAPKIMTILRKEKRLVGVADDLGADMLSVHFSLATRKLVEKAEKRGMPVTIWTADNPRWVKRALDLGLFAVITNDPATLLAKREKL
ncbi:MAG: glycerophosphodiester phosphodiesterase [Acidobacteria bacterium]|nr:glycerophosphodiester phosphodiesterase [Acidobacteriota bacterium]